MVEESYAHLEASCSPLHRAATSPETSDRAENRGPVLLRKKASGRKLRNGVKQTREERNGAFISPISWGSAQTCMIMIQGQELHCDFQVIIGHRQTSRCLTPDQCEFISAAT